MARCVAFLVLVACGGGTSPTVFDAPLPPPPPPDQQVVPAADWVLAISPLGPSAGQLSRALLGHYDLSGSLLDYRANPTLIDRMKAIGLSEWRVGLGRWEFATRLLPTLADGHDTSCAAALARLPASVRAPAGATDATLVADRDWFSDTGTPATLADTNDDSRYKLDYVRSVIDTATAFGAAAYVDIDHMPRSLAAGQGFQRGVVPLAGVTDPCLATWTNHVSNTRPADPAVFAAAVVGVVRRVVEGTPGAPPRDVRYWEIWNEPELGYAWDPSFEQPTGSLNAYFAAALGALGRLADYRAASSDPRVTQLRFGLGSFASAATAVLAMNTLDANPLPDGSFAPIDFVSFHAYSNDPEVIITSIKQVIDARAASTHYRTAELALAEWGPDLQRSPPPTTMELPLMVATVLARGATLGLEHAHHSLFYAFVAGLPYAVVAADGSPLPTYHAYALLHELIGDGASRVEIAGATDGALDGGMGAVLASRTTSGQVRVFVVNRGTTARTARVDASGSVATPSRVEIYDDPAGAPHEVTPSAVVAVPPRSLALITL
ncbi:MAG: hypothetical protein ABIY55_07350, partial [Kofleriaceae bacterium]